MDIKYGIQVSRPESLVTVHPEKMNEAIVWMFWAPLQAALHFLVVLAMIGIGGIAFYANPQAFITGFAVGYTSTSIGIATSGAVYRR